MTRFFMFCAGLFVMASMSGCCLHGGGGPGAFGGPGILSGVGGGCGSCQGRCGVQPGAFPSAAAPFSAQTAFAPQYGAQTAFAPQYGAQTAFASPYGAPTVAFDPLPTIR